MKKDDKNRKIAKTIEIKVQIKLEKLSLFSDIFRFFRFKNIATLYKIFFEIQILWNYFLFEKYFFSCKISKI